MTSRLVLKRILSEWPKRFETVDTDLKLSKEYGSPNRAVRKSGPWVSLVSETG
jgi:hypothetical protein